MSKIKQNMFFALVYNVIGIPIAASVFVAYGLVLKPELAGLAMAMSSISVVGNSLLLKYFKPNRKNYLSIIAPFVMVLVFTFGFLAFAKLSSKMDNSSMALLVSYDQARDYNNFIAAKPSKIDFAEANPKLFLGINNFPTGLKAKVGNLDLADNEMVIGYDEGMMMKREKLIKGPGDSLKDFFGLPSVKIVGILEPTGTLIDDYHFVNMNTFSRLTQAAKITMVAEGKDIDIFYQGEKLAMPEKLISNMSDFTSFNQSGRQIFPVYIGSSDAKLMIKKGKFTKVGDIVQDFPGQTVIIAGILPETKTILDDMRFVGPDFVIKP